MLGDHGWLGLALFLALLISAFWGLQKDIKQSAARQDAARQDLGRAMQVVLIAYTVAGAFLSLAYWDGFYYLLAIVMYLKHNPAIAFQSEAIKPIPPSEPRRFVRAPEPAR